MNAATGPEISILMPVKNAGQFLEVCLKSIQAQTYTNWELIAVDDHSTDSSLHLLQQYSAGDKRIIVTPNPGHGIIEALRKAYSLSKGQYITRMDADDLMLPGRLLRQHTSLIEEPNAISIGPVTYFSENGIGAGYLRYQLWLNELTATGKNFTEIYKECVIPSPCWMVSRSTLNAAGAFEPDTYPEDYDLAFRFYAQGLKCINASASDEPLHGWRDYPERTSRNHENYKDNRFIDLKCNWFVKLDYDANRELIIWGASAKGKLIAKTLQELQVPFHWMCDNNKKIGKAIYGIALKDVSHILQLRNPQVIVAVANPKEQLAIKKALADFGSSAGIDHFFFS